MNTDHFIALYDMENYIWTMTMASWTPLIIHDSYELQTSMISDHSKWGFIRFTRSMITHDCYEHWLWAITVHRNSYEFGFWTINDQTHHTWWGGINAMKCWFSYMINTDSVSYYDPYFLRSVEIKADPRRWNGGQSCWSSLQFVSSSRFASWEASAGKRLPTTMAIMAPLSLLILAPNLQKR